MLLFILYCSIFTGKHYISLPLTESVPVFFQSFPSFFFFFLLPCWLGWPCICLIGISVELFWGQNNTPSQLEYHLFIISHTVATKQGTMLPKLIERVTSNPIRCNWRPIEGPSEVTTTVFRHYCLLTPLDTLIVHVFCRSLILARILESINDNCFQAFAQPSDQPRVCIGPVIFYSSSLPNLGQPLH